MLHEIFSFFISWILFLLFFSIVSYKRAISIYVFVCIYIYMRTYASDSVLSSCSGLLSKASEEEVTSCTLGLSAKETRVISNCESV